MKIAPIQLKNSFCFSVVLILIGAIIYLIIGSIIDIKSYNIVLPSFNDLNLSNGNYVVLYQRNDKTSIDDSKIKLSIIEKSTSKDIMRKNEVINNKNNNVLSASIYIDLKTDGTSWSAFNRFNIINPGAYEIIGQYEGGKSVVKVPIQIIRENNRDLTAYRICQIIAVLMIIGGGIVFVSRVFKEWKKRRTVG